MTVFRKIHELRTTLMSAWLPWYGFPCLWASQQHDRPVLASFCSPCMCKTSKAYLPGVYVKDPLPLL